MLLPLSQSITPAASVCCALAGHLRLMIIVYTRSSHDIAHAKSSWFPHRRWTNEVLEGFLDSTMVEGTGLMLMEHEESGSRKKERVRRSTVE